MQPRAVRGRFYFYEGVKSMTMIRGGDAITVGVIAGCAGGGEGLRIFEGEVVDSFAR